MLLCLSAPSLQVSHRVDLVRLITFFSSSPAAKLLRADHAPYVIYFLHQHFKVNGNLATEHSVFASRLAAFLEDVHVTEPEVLKDRAESYLTYWSTGDSRWLRRFFDADHSEPVYQLTPHSEDVLRFLTEVLERDVGFVGTESRLTRIIATLSDIVVKGSSDPTTRLEYLYSERDRILDEIRSVEAGNVVETYNSTAIRERFSDAVSDLISLQSDFRAVEESFKEITRDVQRRQTERHDTRGGILGFALEAEDELKEGDQGASFGEFVRLILSHRQQETVEEIIAKLKRVEELADHHDGMRRIDGMISSLSAEAEKVLRTTRRLSSTLRRLLDSKQDTSRKRLAELLREVKTLAVQQAESPPAIGLHIDASLDIRNAWQRTFWSAPVEFEDLTISNDQPDENDLLLRFRELAAMRRLDWQAMRSTVQQLLQTRQEVTLPELVDESKLESGTIELLGYVQLAHDDGHVVDDTAFDRIRLPQNNGHVEQVLRVPRVTFLSAELREFRAGFENSEVQS